MDRASLRWLAKRRFRAGQVHRRAFKERGVPIASPVIATLAKIAYCAGALLLNAFNPEQRMREVLRGTLHAGFIASAFGAETYEEYA